MPNAKINHAYHHGWKIQVIEHLSKFSFRCHHFDLEEWQYNGATYCSYNEALCAGRNFIDREIALLSLINLFEELMQEGKLTLDEYWNLANFSDDFC